MDEWMVRAVAMAALHAVIWGMRLALAPGRCENSQARTPAPLCGSPEHMVSAEAFRWLQGLRRVPGRWRHRRTIVARNLSPGASFGFPRAIQWTCGRASLCQRA